MRPKRGDLIANFTSFATSNLRIRQEMGQAKFSNIFNQCDPLPPHTLNQRPQPRA